MYDAALVRLRGAAAATNFALADYRHDLAAYQKMQQARLRGLRLVSDHVRDT